MAFSYNVYTTSNPGIAVLSGWADTAIQAGGWTLTGSNILGEPGAPNILQAEYLYQFADGGTTLWYVLLQWYSGQASLNNVQIKITSLTASDAVLSGIFFDP